LTEILLSVASDIFCRHMSMQSSDSFSIKLLNRLLEVSHRNASTSGPTPC